MGFNTTVVVMNDALSWIAEDPNFGKTLAAAISKLSVSDGQSIDVPAYSYKDGNPSGGVHCNAATAIETHHADGTVVVAVGQNYGEVLNTYHIHAPSGDNRNVTILKALADELGYRVSKKPQPKRTS